MRYAWGPCPFPGGCTEARPHIHYNPQPGAPIELIYDDEDWYHVGHPADPDEAAERQTAGLPVYRPTDPVAIDQTPYLRYAGARP